MTIQTVQPSRASTITFSDVQHVLHQHSHEIPCHEVRSLSTMANRVLVGLTEADHHEIASKTGGPTGGGNAEAPSVHEHLASIMRARGILVPQPA